MSKTKVWHVYGIVTGGKYIGTVEAETKKEAEELAWDHANASVSLCHQCSGECADAVIDHIEVEEEEEG